MRASRCSSCRSRWRRRRGSDTPRTSWSGSGCSSSPALRSTWCRARRCSAPCCGPATWAAPSRRTCASATRSSARHSFPSTSRSSSGAASGCATSGCARCCHSARRSDDVKTLARLLAGALILGATCSFEAPALAAAHNPELEYLEAVNRTGPPRDPELLFLLMGAYANANRDREGAEFFEARLAEFGPRLSDVQKSLYLSAIGILRAGYAQDVSLLKRIGFVKETLGKLDEAKRLSQGQVFVVRWASGVVSARVPSFFGRRDVALEDLEWCLANAGKAPHPGWMREVYIRLGDLHRRDGDAARAEDLRRLVGDGDPEEPITLTTPFAEDPATGHTFSARKITEVVPRRVYLLSGFEFTEYGFVVSSDRRHLVAIDAGTRPDSARAAYEALRAYARGLPDLTTVLITHSHWDHLGGHRFFRSLGSHPKFYARSNGRDEIARGMAAPRPFLPHFFGTRFDIEDVQT